MSKEVELPRARWSDEVHTRLVELIKTRGAASPSWDPCSRPLAVFDWDNTVIAGDIGDSAFASALEEGLLAPEGAALDALLAPLPTAHVEPLKGAWPRAKWLAPAEPPADLRWRVHRAYEDMCKEKGNSVCYPWMTQAFAGWSEPAAIAFAERTITKELERAIAPYPIEGSGEAVSVVRGVRLRPEMVALIGALDRGGFDVFIVTASPEWLVQAFVSRVGLTKERVIGMRTTLGPAGFSSMLDQPVTYRAGKVAAIRTRVPPGGRVPVFAAGDALTDLEMLEEASDLALFMDRGDPTVRARADARGWAVQRPFELQPALTAVAPAAAKVAKVKPKR